jgi:hypothetical protein
MEEHQKFVIVSLPRTGSTYLVDYLDAVDGVRCLSEIFHPSEIQLRHHTPADASLGDMAVRNADPFGYLARIEADVGACRRFGFKHFPRHNLALLQHLAADRAWRKIFLWRDNLVEQYLSFLIASMHFGRAGWGRVPAEVKMRVPLVTLMEDLHTMQQNYFLIEDALAASHPDDVFGIEYDDLGRPAVMAGLHKFLGLPAPGADPAAASADLKFERGPTASQRIANYDEIRRLLKSGRYRRWVED